MIGTIEWESGMPEFHQILGSIDLSQITGGSIQSATDIQLTYRSKGGITLVLHGTGFVYGVDDLPTAGTITSIDLTAKDSQASLTQMDFSLTNFVTLALGKTSGSDPVKPDVVALVSQIFVGDDSFTGNDDYDELRGFAGNDTLSGAGAGDWLSGGKGVDSYDGGAGIDGIHFYGGVVVNHGVTIDMSLTVGNIVDDGFGNTETAINIEKIQGTVFDDVMTGHDGKDGFFGGQGNDTLSGAGGADTLTGGAGDGVYYGGGGHDYMNASNGHDSYSGGAGRDELSFFYTRVTEGIVVDLSLSSGQIINDGFGIAENATGIEMLAGATLADSLTGDGQRNLLRGNGGDDTLSGGEGDDDLYGGSGNDLIYGGTGDDFIYAFFGSDRVTGGDGADHFNLFGDLADHVLTTITDMQSGRRQDLS